MAYTRLPTANFSLLAVNNATDNGSGFILDYPLFVFDDNSVILFKQSVVNFILYVYVYDASGKYTYYSYFSNSGFDYVVNIIPFGNGKFLIGTNNGKQIIQQFSNAKLNNLVPIPITSNIDISTPCYGPPSKYFYDIETNVLGCVAYDPVGQDGGPVFDAEYLVNSLGLILLSSGYTGNYYTPTNTDPYDLRTHYSTGHNYYNWPLIQSNSITSNLEYYLTGEYFISRNNIGVHVGKSTQCQTINNSPTTGSYVYSKQATNNFFEQFGYSAYAILDSNILGINGAYLSPNNIIELFDLYGNVFDVSINCNGGGYYKGVVVTKSHIFLLDNVKQNLYIAPYNFKNPFNNINPFIPTNQNGNSSQYAQAKNLPPQPVLLTNFHRPVSILGKYKA